MHEDDTRKLDQARQEATRIRVVHRIAAERAHPADTAAAPEVHRGTAYGRQFFLPGYSSQLNPGEWVRKNIKADRRGRGGLTSAAEMGGRSWAALSWLQKLPRLARGFLAGPDLFCITAG